MSTTLPALHIRPPRFEGPLEQYGRLVQLRSLMQSQQVNALRLEQAQREARLQKEQEEKLDAVNKIISKHNGDWRSALPEISAVFPEYAMGLKQQDFEMSKAGSEAKITKLELLSARTKRVRSRYREIFDESSYQRVIGELINEGTLEGERGQYYLQLGYDPKRVAAAQRATVSLDKILDYELDREKAAETKRHRLAIEVPEKERRFQAFYPSYRESRGLPKNAKVEQQARREFARLGKAEPKAEKPKKLTANQRQLIEARRNTRRLNWRQEWVLDPGREGEYRHVRGILDNITEDQFRAELQRIEDDYRSELRAAEAGEAPAAAPPAPLGIPAHKHPLLPPRRPTAPGKTLDSETARKILQEAGGDKEKARRIARERGYIF